MKDKITLSIDKETLELAKEHMPNISKFVEGCLKAYFEYITDDEKQKGEELRKNWEDFHRAKMNIHILMTVNDKQKDIDRAKNDALDDAWLSIWVDYKLTGNYQPYAMDEAVKTLEVTEEELKEVMENCLIAAKQDMTKVYIFDSWEYVKENYLPYISLGDEGLEEFYDLLH